MDANCYGVLGIPEGASPKEIRRAYLSLIQRVHPDRNALPDAASRAARLNAAYEILSDPERRSVHDARLRASRISASPSARMASSAAVRETPTDRSLWVQAVAVGGLVLCVLLAFVWIAASRAAVNPPAEGTTPPAWARVAALIDTLKGIVSVRASVAGTHMEDAVVVTDYSLDRSRFDSQELYGIAADIRQELDESPNADGFIARAYFNARLLAISVDVLARLDRGESISRQVAEVRALDDPGPVHVWLERSQFAASYRDLIDCLERYGDKYATGQSSAELAADLKSKDNVLAGVRTQLTANRLSGRLDSYDSLVAAHNQLADETNAMAQALVARSKIAEELDLAFNRALDPAVIFGSPGG